MNCPGHSGSKGCFLYKQQKSFWGLCVSCERIQNRLFLETVQKAIRLGETTFSFHESIYSLNDPSFPERFLGRFRFVSSSQDPRLSLLMICYTKDKPLFHLILKSFIQDISFMTSANLLFRKHLPSQATCATLYSIQKASRQHFLDMPSCPCCMSRYLVQRKEALPSRWTEHIYSIFRNRVLAQHPTWFVSIFKLLQTIWEQDLENKITFQALNTILVDQNPIEFQIEFRDWMAAFLETPIVIEKILSGKISEGNKEYLRAWTGQTIDMPFIKRLQRNRMAAWEEDLIIKTWHPSRLMTWCFDLEELKDFA